jgi:hypothetical protein
MTRPHILTLATLLLAGCSFSSTPTTTPTPETFEVRGTVVLDRGQFVWGNDGPSDLRCTGQDGFDDIRPGAQITVTDPAGKVVALGKVRDGNAQLDETGKIGLECILPFEAAKVPGGLGFYGVQVAHRGAVRFSEAALTVGIRLAPE